MIDNCKVTIQIAGNVTPEMWSKPITPEQLYALTMIARCARSILDDPLNEKSEKDNKLSLSHWLDEYEGNDNE